jgi:hypothetical protein
MWFSISVAQGNTDALTAFRLRRRAEQLGLLPLFVTGKASAAC